MIIFGVFGSSGKMGQETIKALRKLSNFEIMTFSKGDDLRGFCNQCDLIIDFSIASASLELFKTAQNSKCLIVSGTTAFQQEHFDLINELSKSRAILYSANMSIAVAVMRQALILISNNLGSGFDVDISEQHHIHKKDAPSGTAIMLAESISDLYPNPHFSYERKGEIIGNHIVKFDSEFDVITLTHHAKQRNLFAIGAVKAAIWLYENHHNSKGLFSIDDMISDGGNQR